MKYNITYKNILVQLAIILCFSGALAQKAKVARANINYDKYSFIDAREIYLKVVEKGYNSVEIYQKLGDTYYFNGDYQNAANWYLKSIETYPEQTNATYYYRAAQTQKSVGNLEKYETFIERFEALSKDDVKRYVTSDSDTENLNEYIVEALDQINTSESEFGTAFFGNKLVFSSSSGKYSNEKGKKHRWNNERFLDLYEAKINEESGYSEIKPLMGNINSPLHESTPVFTKDGNTVYFTRNNYKEGKRGRDKTNHTRLKIYRASKMKDNSWGNIVELPFNNDEYSFAHPALSPNEEKLFFSSDMPGTLGQSDLWYVTISPAGTYGEPVNLGESVNSSEKESFPFISASGDLYFSSNADGSNGGLDIFICKPNSDGTYESPQNLGTTLNSGYDDFAFILDEKKGVGYMSSNRDLKEGIRSDDIYKVTSVIIIQLAGKITSELSDEPIPGTKVELYDSNNNILETVNTDDSGSYNFTKTLEPDSRYTIKAVSTDCDPNEKVILTPDKSAALNGDMTLNCNDCPVNDLGCRLSLQPIYFDFDQHYIRKDAEVELAKILTALNEYPDLKIHIESHTDSRGNDTYNQDLSDRRARSTMEWLIAKGISRERLSSKGYGESQLINECSNNVKCSEEKHQLNRRSVFIIKN